MSKTIRNVSAVTAASALGYMLAMIRGFIVPRALGPADYGLWGAFNLVLLYGFNLHGGVSHAMNREVSAARGAGEEARAGDLRSTAFTWIGTGILTVTVLASVGVGLYALEGGEARIALCLALVILALPLQQLDVYVLTVLRTEHRFGWIALSRTLAASGSLLLLILLLPSVGLYAMPLGVIAMYALGSGFLLRRLPARPQIRWAPQDGWMLLRVGFPLLLITLVFALFRSVDRFVILKYLDIKQLGFYGVAGVFLELVYMLPESIGAVLNPQFNEAYGRAQDPAALRGLLWRSVSTISLLLAPAAGLAFVTLEYPIRLVLPAYVSAIVPAQILVIGAYFWGTARVTEFFFIAAKHPYAALGLQLGAVGLNLAVSLTLVSRGYGLVGVAVATAVAYGVYGFAAILLSLRIAALPLGTALVWTLTAFWPLGLALAGIGLVRVLLAPIGDVVFSWPMLEQALWRCLLVLAACLPALWILARRMREARA